MCRFHEHFREQVFVIYSCVSRIFLCNYHSSLWNRQKKIFACIFIRMIHCVCSMQSLISNNVQAPLIILYCLLIPVQSKLIMQANSFFIVFIIYSPSVDYKADLAINVQKFLFLFYSFWCKNTSDSIPIAFDD